MLVDIQEQTYIYMKLARKFAQMEEISKALPSFISIQNIIQDT